MIAATVAAALLNVPAPDVEDSLAESAEELDELTAFWSNVCTEPTAAVVLEEPELPDPAAAEEEEEEEPAESVVAAADPPTVAEGLATVLQLDEAGALRGDGVTGSPWVNV